MTELLRVYDPSECHTHRGRRSTSTVGYPLAWAKCTSCDGTGLSALGRDVVPAGGLAGPVSPRAKRAFTCAACQGAGSIKNLIRQLAGHRCVRCGHLFIVGESGVMDGPQANAKAFAADLGLSVETLDLALNEIDRDDPLLAERLDETRRTNWSDCDERCEHGGPIRFSVPIAEGWTAWEVVPDDLGPRDLIVNERARVQASWRILTVHHLNERKEDCRWHNLVALCQRCRATLRFRGGSTWSSSIRLSTPSGSDRTPLPTTRPSTSARN